MSKIFTKFRQKKGFTLVEMIVSTTIFVIVVSLIGIVFMDFYASKHKTEISRILYEESRTALERIVKEVRRGTIDYEEYWNRFKFQSAKTDNKFYGKNYGDYARQFYRETDGSVPLDLAHLDRFDENVGENISLSNPALQNAKALAVCESPAKIPAEPGTSGYEQCELYLITAEGLEKTIIKVEPTIGTEIEYQLKMLKLPGRDSDNDNRVDDWNIYNSSSPNPSDSKFYDFCKTFDSAGSGACTEFQFQKIQPESIKITALKFFISPKEDPRKAFADFSEDVQIQPHVTIQLSAEPSIRYSDGIRGEIPSVTIQTTVDARAQNEVKSSQ